MKNAERNARLRQMKDEGRTVSELSEFFNITAQRVRQILVHGKPDSRAKPPAFGWAPDLSVRIRNNLLLNYGLDVATQPALIVERGRKTLREWLGMGAVQERQVSEALRQAGLISNSKEW